MVGRTTTGAYGYSIGKSLAVGYVKSEHAAPGTEMKIEMLGKRRAARLIADLPGIRRTNGSGREKSEQ